MDIHGCPLASSQPALHTSSSSQSVLIQGPESGSMCKGWVSGLQPTQRSRGQVVCILHACLLDPACKTENWPPVLAYLGSPTSL